MSVHTFIISLDSPARLEKLYQTRSLILCNNQWSSQRAQAIPSCFAIKAPKANKDSVSGHIAAEVADLSRFNEGRRELNVILGYQKL